MLAKNTVTEAPSGLVTSRYIRFAFEKPPSSVTLWRWIKSGAIPQPAVVIRGRHYWHRDDLDRALAKMSRPADAA